MDQKKKLYRKTLSVAEAAYFMGMSANRLRNLIKIGRYDFGQMEPNIDGGGDLSKNGRCRICPVQFFAFAGITWDDVFELRQQAT